MEKRNVVLDEAKVREYSEVLSVIRQTVKKEDVARVCLNNRTLRQLAGYTEDDIDEENINPYVRDYLDKLTYDEHNKKVEEAKSKEDNGRLQELSNEIMGMAGYKKESAQKRYRINKYAKSFVDRTLMERQLQKLYSAMSNKDEEKINEAYMKIFEMTSYSSNRPYGVINEFAQGFVDNRVEEYRQKGIQIPQEIALEDNNKYAI